MIADEGEQDVAQGRAGVGFEEFAIQRHAQFVVQADVAVPAGLIEQHAVATQRLEGLLDVVQDEGTAVGAIQAEHSQQGVDVAPRPPGP